MCQLTNLQTLQDRMCVEEQLHEAEAMFARVKEQPKPLSFYV